MLTFMKITRAFPFLALLLRPAGAAAGDLYPVSSAFEAAAGDSVAGHACVDLGISVRWAVCNVGADAPEQEGRLFAWGDTAATNVAFDWKSYALTKDSSDYLLKYNPDSLAGRVDGAGSLLPGDDMAACLWGDAWRMPSADELLELRDACVWGWVDDYNGRGVPGLLGFSRLNGNSIFLPATSFAEGDKDCLAGWYWSASLCREDPTFALQFFFAPSAKPEDVGVVPTPRCYGRFVRAVVK